MDDTSIGRFLYPVVGHQMTESINTVCHPAYPELLETVDWVNEKEDAPVWLLEDTIPMRNLVLVSGVQKVAFKSYFCMAASIAVATGQAVDRLVPVDQGKVLYIAEEGVSIFSKARYKAICAAHGIDFESARAHHATVWQKNVLLNDPAWLEKIKAWVKHLQPKLIILDSLYNMNVGNENDTQEASQLMRSMRILRNICGSTIMFITHLTKGSQREKGQDMDLEVRGSSTIVGAYDTHVGIRKVNPKDENDTDLLFNIRKKDGRPVKFYGRWTIKSHKNEIPFFARLDTWEEE